MIDRPEKFYNNSERIAYLRKCFESDRQHDVERGMRLAWEWCKTGTFDRVDFERVLEAYALSTRSAT